MDCISCRRTDVFNRVVVDRRTGGPCGLFCEDCESETFGGLLADPTWHREDGCAFCERDAQFELPALDCLVQRDGEDPTLEYADRAETVALCGAHLDVLRTPEAHAGSPLEA